MSSSAKYLLLLTLSISFFGSELSKIKRALINNCDYGTVFNGTNCERKYGFSLNFQIK